MYYVETVSGVREREWEMQEKYKDKIEFIL